MSMSMLTLNEVMVVFEVVVVVVVGQVLWQGCSVAVLFDGHCLFVYPIHPLFCPPQGFVLAGGWSQIIAEKCWLAKRAKTEINVAKECFSHKSFFPLPLPC